MKKRYPAKPKELRLPDVTSECHSEEYDDHGGGAFNVEIVGGSIYTSKDVRKFITYLEKAEKWMEHKEKYLKAPKGFKL